jgi:hypothetical protein
MPSEPCLAAEADWHFTLGFARMGRRPPGRATNFDRLRQTSLIVMGFFSWFFGSCAPKNSALPPELSEITARMEVELMPSATYPLRYEMFGCPSYLNGDTDGRTVC